MNRTWKYLENQFLIQTEDSFLKALKLAEYTNAALLFRNADPFFDDLYLYFNPLYKKLNDEFDEWDTQKGTQKGKTHSVSELLRQLGKEKINAWDLAVQVAGIAKDTSNYIALFPNGHHPFQSGTIIERINAIHAFSLAIGLQLPPLPPPTDPLLILQGEVDAFYTLINDTRTEQEGQISDTGTESDEVNEARVNAMVGLYAVLGDCMNKFADNPIVIEPLFDLETLRNIAQRMWNQSIPAGQTRFLFKRTLEPAKKIRLIVHSTKPIQFAFVNEKNDDVPPAAFTVQGLEEEIVDASVLGNVPDDKFFKVKNTDDDVEGHFTVEIV